MRSNQACGLVLTVVAGLAAATGQAWAQPVLITAPQTVSPGQTTITPTAGGPAVPLATAEVTVQGATLTVNGRHSIASLTITNSGIVTHSPAFQFDYSGNGSDVVSGMQLTTTADVSLVNGSIEVNGKGWGGGLGSGAGGAGDAGTGHGGGGGHGGSGARYQGGAAGGAPHGGYTQPREFGSGGGATYYLGNLYAGGAGGGCVRLNVGGTLSVGASGQVRANGVFGTATPQGYASGGAGGSVWITAGTVTGTGTIEAMGGFGYGAGGGGRISIDAGTWLFTGLLRAFPGQSDAGTGTVYRIVGSAVPELIFSGSGNNELTQPLNVTGNLITRSGAFLSHSPGAVSGLNITVTGDATFESGSGINVVGKGTSAGGAGAGGNATPSNPFGGGGSHGGSGAAHDTGVPGAFPHGSYTQPTTLGGAGGTTYYTPTGASFAGGAGGGAVRLVVGGALTVSGEVRANGVFGTQTPQGYAAAGAGGSVWITAGELAGQGTIEANGGFGYGSGGGGRIAIETPLWNFSGTARARAGGSNAGTGTLYKVVGVQTPELIFDGSGRNELDEPLVVQNANLILRSGAYLAHRRGDTDGLTISVTGNATFESGAGIDVTGAGYAGGQGPGAGANGQLGSPFGGGGSHGGSGGVQQAGLAGALPYDSYTSPTLLGSGGGGYFYEPGPTSYAGGAGGGAVRLAVTGTLHVSGDVRADGVFGQSSPQGYASGGAGGSVWMTAGSLTGSGTITANGAFGYPSGGGGRVALTTPTSSFSGTVRARSGASEAGTGTVYRAIGSASPQLIYDGNGTNVLSELDVAGADLVLRGGAVLTHAAGSPAGLTITADQDVVIESGSGINVNGRGYGSGMGPGAGVHGTPASPWGGGGGYGGMGETFLGGNAGGNTFGDPTQPLQLGSGGGSYHYASNGQSYAGGAGGGAVRLRVRGDLLLNGFVHSDGLFGQQSPQGYASGGSGGSLWVSAGSISGVGSIEADGAFGYGSGGGGRVAVYSCNFTLPPTNVRARAGNSSAGAGTVHFATATATISPSIVCATGDITLSVAAVGDTGSIQWRRNGVALTDGPTPSGGEIVGSSTTTLLILHAGSNDDGRYDAFIAGACGGSTSNEAVLTVNTSDFNNDGDFGTDADIEAFFACLGGNCCPDCDSYDFDGDGDFGTDGDIETFFRVLGGGVCG